MIEWHNGNILDFKSLVRGSNPASVFRLDLHFAKVWSKVATFEKSRLYLISCYSFCQCEHGRRQSRRGGYRYDVTHLQSYWGICSSVWGILGCFWSLMQWRQQGPPMRDSRFLQIFEIRSLCGVGVGINLGHCNMILTMQKQTMKNAAV